MTRGRVKSYTSLSPTMPPLSQAVRPSPAVRPGSRGRQVLLAFIALFAALLFLELSGSWLCDPDESRYAEIPREMLAARDAVTPLLNGSHYFEKPPLLYWAGAASEALFGRTPFASRLPVRLAALGTAGLLAAGLETAAAPDWGLWAALLVLSAPLSFVLGRFSLTDGLLAFTLTASFMSLRGFLRAREERRPAGAWAAASGASIALAVLTKGLIGIVFPGLVFLLWIGLLGRWRRLTEFLLSSAPWVFLALAAPWFILVERANPGFGRIFFIREHFQRFATNEAHRGGPFYFMAAAFFLGFLPWTGPFLRGLAPLARRSRAGLLEHADELFFALWALVIVLFFSVSKSKLTPYVLPAFPAAAALAARVLASPPSDEPWRRRWLLFTALFWTAAAAGGLAYGFSKGELARYGLELHAFAGAACVTAGSWAAWALSRGRGGSAWLASASGLAGLYLCAALAYPRIAGDLSAHDLAAAAAGMEDRTVVGYRTFSYNLPWELGRAVPVSEYRDELASDGLIDTRLFWSGGEFWRRWNSGEKLAVLVRKADLGEFGREGVRPPATAAQNRTYALITN